jgi:diguanylate cyclase (GGDEF)-like protein/PAS domain S-box-containing protein
MRVSLRILLLVPFLLEVVGITSLMGYLSHRSGERAVEDLAQQLIIETGDRVTQNLNYYFGVAEDLVAENKATIELGLLDWQDFSKVEDFFIRQLQIHDLVSSLFIVTDSEDCLVVARDYAERLVVHEHLHPPGVINTYIVDSEGNFLYSGNSNIYDDLPEAQATKLACNDTSGMPETGQWLTIFSSSSAVNQPTLRLARLAPFVDAQGNAQGVISATFLLDQVGQFLQDLEISEHGQVFIVDNQGFLVASSTGEPLLNSAPEADPDTSLSPKEWRLAAIDSPEPVTRSAMVWSLEQLSPTTAEEDAGLGRFDISNEAYFIYEVPFQVDEQINWKVIIAIPEADFTAAIQANTRRTFLLCGTALLGAIGFGWWVMRRVTRPLKQLDRATQQYAQQGTLQPLRYTRVREVDSLRQSFEQMVAVLDRQKADMEAFHTNYAQSLERQVQAQTQAYQTSEARLREALDIAGAVAWERDLQTDDVLFISPATLQMPRQMTTEQVIAQIHPDDQDLVRRVHAEAIAQTGNFRIEHRAMDSKDPSVWRWFQAYGRVVTDETHNPTRVVGMSLDITERKQIEVALRQANQDMEAVLEAFPDLLYYFAADGTIQGHRVRKEQQLYLSPEQFLGKKVQDVLPPEEGELYYRAIQRTLASGSIESIEYSLPMQHQTSYFEARLVALNEHNVIAVIRDITHRKQTEIKLHELSRELLEWRDRYEMATWAGNQIIYEYDVEKNCYTWGASTREILGYTVEEMPQTLEEEDGFVYPGDYLLFAELMDAKKHSSDPFKLEFRVRRQDGTYIWVEDQGVPQLDDRGKPVRIIGAVRDINDFKRAEIELNNAMDLLQQSEAKYLAILQYQTEMIARFKIDGTVMFVNEAFCRYYDISKERVIGHKYHPLIYPEDQPAIDDCLAALSPETPVATVQNRVLVKGEIRWTEWTNRAIYDDNGNLIELQMVGRDIHDRKQAEAALNASQAKFQRLVEDIGEKYVVFSHTLPDNMVTYVSEGIQPVFGLRREEIEGQRWQDVINWVPEDLAMTEALDQEMVEKQRDFQQYEMRFTHPSGELRTIAVSQHLVRDSQGDCIAMEGILEDITERKQAEQALKQLNAQLEKQATQDSLTQIANRRKMEAVLQQEWKRCQRHHQPMTLILLDIDHFKPYNDNYGHPQGDECLRQVSQVLQTCATRPEDLVARYGGEEFLLILPNTEQSGAVTVAQHIQACIAELGIPHDYSPVSTVVTVSLGIAVVAPVSRGLTYNAAILLADQSLYKAKQTRNTYHVEVLD